jgi:hypothetical protein
LISQPWDQLVEAELVSLVEAGEEIPSLLGIGRETRAVDGEKGIRGGEGRALVAIDEGMVLRQALPECGCFLDQAGVITGLRPVEGGRSDGLSVWRGILPDSFQRGTGCARKCSGDLG